MNKVDTMVQKLCSHPACNRVNRFGWRFSRNKVHKDYCSLFCQMNAEGLDGGPVILDAPELRKFRQKDTCLCCGAEFVRTWTENWSNQRLCSSECSNTVANHKNGKRNFQVLVLLKEVDFGQGLTGQDLFDYLKLTVYSIKSAAGVTTILRRWIRCGALEKVSRTGSKNQVAAAPIYRFRNNWQECAKVTTLGQLL